MLVLCAGEGGGQGQPHTLAGTAAHAEYFRGQVTENKRGAELSVQILAPNFYCFHFLAHHSLAQFNIGGVTASVDET